MHQCYNKYGALSLKDLQFAWGSGYGQCGSLWAIVKAEQEQLTWERCCNSSVNERDLGSMVNWCPCRCLRCVCYAFTISCVWLVQFSFTHCFLWMKLCTSKRKILVFQLFPDITFHPSRWNKFMFLEQLLEQNWLICSPCSWSSSKSRDFPSPVILPTSLRLIWLSLNPLL